MSGAYLSPRMVEVLRHAEAGRPLDTGLRGRSAYGGFSRTCTALTSAGLLDRDFRITDAGRQAITAAPAATPTDGGEGKS